MLEKATELVADVLAAWNGEPCMKRLGAWKQWSPLLAGVGAGKGRMLLFAARFAAACSNERRLGVGEKLKVDGGGGGGGGAASDFDCCCCCCLLAADTTADWLSWERLIGFRFLRYGKESENILGGGSLSSDETPVARLAVVVLDRDAVYWNTVDVFKADISEPSFKALALRRGAVATDADVPLNKSCAKLAPAASLWPEGSFDASNELSHSPYVA